MSTYTTSCLTILTVHSKRDVEQIGTACPKNVVVWLCDRVTDQFSVGSVLLLRKPKMTNSGSVFGMDLVDRISYQGRPDSVGSRAVRFRVGSYKRQTWCWTDFYPLLIDAHIGTAN